METIGKGFLATVGVVVAFVVLLGACGALLSAGESTDHSPVNAVPDVGTASPTTADTSAKGAGTTVCTFYDGEESLPIDVHARSGALTVVAGTVTGREPASLQQAAANFEWTLDDAQQKRLNDALVRELNAYCS